VTILQLHTPDIADWAEVALASKEEYAGRWGFDFLPRVEHRPVNAIHPAWLKVLFLLDAMQGYPDGHILWMTDADLCITNMGYPPPTMPDDSVLHMWYDGKTINSGSMLVRNSKETRDFFEKIWSDRQKPYGCWEQCAIVSRRNELAGLTLDTSPKWQPNVYAHKWRDGDFTCHLTACSKIPRYLMSEFVSRTKR
jgi:hypothetical protein